MKLFIFNKDSNQFLNHSNSWTTDRSEAKVFTDRVKCNRQRCSLMDLGHRVIEIDHEVHKYTLKKDYYGNEDYGKRVYWISIDDQQTNDYVWVQDSEEYIRMLKAIGHKVDVIN